MPYIGQSPYQVAFLVDTFSGNGSTTAFTTSVAPANTASVLVAISGVVQDPSTYSVSGTTLTFSVAPPTGTGNISARYLGIPASGVTTTAYRTQTEFTATAGQTTFTPPSYTVGFIQVFRNGVLLGSADYTATNGTTVVLTTGATAGDLITTISFYVSSVLNAIPATAGSVGSTYLAGGAVLQSNLGTNVGGNGPAFSAYMNATQTFSARTTTKIQFNATEFDTNNNYSTSNYRFTPTIAGYYLITAGINANFATGESSLELYKGGNWVKLLADQGSPTLYVLSGSALIYCSGPSDYIEIYCYSQNNFTSQSNSTRTFFQGFLARSA